MRKNTLVSLVVSAAFAFIGFASGCSAPVDPTPNQMAPSTNANYPTGPFGYSQGSVIEDLQLIGKTDPDGAAGTANYMNLPMAPVQLSNFYGDPNIHYIYLSGVAGWCGPCNNEQASVVVAQGKYESKGIKFLEAMNEGFDESTGAPATEADLDTWAGRHSLHVTLATDPNDRLHQYADETAFPLNMVIRTSDMQIVFAGLGQEDLDDVLSQYAQ